MSKPIQKKCGTCRFLRPREDGKPFYHGHMYQCVWALSPDVKTPDSFRGHSFEHLLRSLRGGHGGYMSPKDGAACPCWEARQ